MTIVLAATAGGLWRVGDREGWILEGRDVTALTSSDEGLWAVVDGAELWRSADVASWDRVASAEGPPVRCVLATGQVALVGTAQAGLLRLADGRLDPVAGFDEVEGRDGWYTPWGGPPDTRSISASAEAIYVNVHVGGIPRSTDGGRTWRPTIDVDADVHQVLAAPGQTDLVLAACALGLAVSEDAGEKWRMETEGLHASYCRAVAIVGETVLVSASTGPRTRQGAVYRAPLGGGAFERCGRGLPEWFPANVDTHCLAGSGSTVAIGTDRGEVFLSGDEGQTWERVAEGLPPVTGVIVM